jgi:hypothetical protein
MRLQKVRNNAHTNSNHQKMKNLLQTTFGMFQLMKGLFENFVCSFAHSIILLTGSRACAGDFVFARARLHFGSGDGPLQVAFRATRVELPAPAALA